MTILDLFSRPDAGRSIAERLEVDPSIIECCPRDAEPAIAFLRSKGVSIMKSVIVLHCLHGLSPGDAKEAVFWSETWSDYKPVRRPKSGRTVLRNWKPE